MFQDDTQAISCIGEDVDDTRVEDRHTVIPRTLASLEDDDRTTGLVELRIEPVPERKGSIAVRLVLGLVVVVVDGDGEVVL